MQDNYQPLTELAPTWKRIDPNDPPAWARNAKMIFKTDHGAATIGVWYPGCEWTWACGLPKHTPEQKRSIMAREAAKVGA